MPLPVPPSLLGRLTGTQRLVLMLALLAVATLLLALWTQGLAALAIAGVTLAVGLWLLRPIWLPPEWASARVRRASLTAVTTVALSTVGWGPQLEPLLRGVLERLGQQTGADWLQHLPAGSYPGAALLFAFVLAAVVVVNYFARDRSVMRSYPRPLDDEFPERNYRRGLEQFCEVLRANLNDLNHQTNWSNALFVPLDAEVEVVSGGRSRRRVTDLMDAIRSNRTSKAFLVLGDPGSGKSVALRKLAAELLDEVAATGRVPVYLNLKEWEPAEQWSEENPPTPQHIQQFVLDNLKARMDVYSNEFLDRYFEPMLENGRFFLLLDSFDEMPAVLDARESAWLIDRLSSAISRFLAGATETRAVVASRFYRRPSLMLDEIATLEIRPFTELRIEETLGHSQSSQMEGAIRTLFKERIELLPIARNPFTADLIRSYVADGDGSLPPNQMELYRAYIDRRLRAAHERMARKGLTADEVIAGAIAIADLMFRAPDLGLEAPLSVLENRLPGVRVRELAGLLHYARLARLGRAEEERFSFVHRRFNEYFVARRLMEEPQRLALESIPEDSRWRDALVMYCEVADEAQATAVAEFCWGEIETLRQGDYRPGSGQHLRAVHSLRFLRDAFRSRPECLAGFRAELGRFIEEEVELKHGLLSAKIALEATGLLDEAAAEPVIVKALSIGDEWISATALRACRHFGRLSEELTGRIRAYLDSIPVLEFYRQFRELEFSLKLSEGFSEIRTFCRVRWVRDFVFVLSSSATLLLFPSVSIAWMGALVTVHAFYFVFSYTDARNGGPLPNDGSGAPGWLVRVVEYSNRVVAAAYFEYKKVGVYMDARIDSWATRMEALFATLLISALGLFALVDVFVVRAVEGRYDRVLAGLAGYPLRDPLIYAQGQLRSIVVGVLLFGMLCWYLLGTGLIARMRLFVNSLNFMVPFMLLVSVPAGGVALLGYWLLSMRIVGEYWLMAMFAAFPVVMLFKGAYVKALGFYCDLVLLPPILAMKENIPRPLLEQTFLSFRTPWGRRKYVERLKQSRCTPTGQWQNGLPNVKNDRSSAMLAELEERWLGLDR